MMPTFEIPDKMKAMELVAYDKLELREVPVPQPGPGEVLCRIKSVAICGSDPKLIHGGYKFANWPPSFPFIMGHEWAGQVVAIGEGVAGFQPGDRVAGEAHAGCGQCENCKQGHYTVCLNYGKDGLNSPVDLGHRHYGFNWQGANMGGDGRVIHPTALVSPDAEVGEGVFIGPYSIVEDRKSTRLNSSHLR